MGRVVTWVALLVSLGLPAGAHAGTVTRDPSLVTYRAAPATGAPEQVFLSVEEGRSVVSSDRGVTSTDCQQIHAQRVECAPPAPGFAVFFLGFDDVLSSNQLIDASTVEAHGGAGEDVLEGGLAGDNLFGDDGDDKLEARGGADTLDGGLGGDTLIGNQGTDTLRGGEGDDSLEGGDDGDLLDGGPGSDATDDGAGDDRIDGGPGDDRFFAGTGRDVFAGGDGSDRGSYEVRTAAVTVTLDGQPDDGEAGEGDNMGADIEEGFGGSGNDRIIGNALGNTLRGGAGNDFIFAGGAQDRVEGEEGDDTIDVRDGDNDSIDCGPGNDTVYGDPGDVTQGCEIAPDADGDGSLTPQDCAPNDPAVHPGAGEVFGNAIDENCDKVVGYLRVINPVTYDIDSAKRPARVRFRRLVIGEIRKGDRIQMRCKGGGCPFTRKSVTGKSGRRTVNLAKHLKRRYLRRGATLEIRVLRTNEIGKVVRYVVTRTAKVKSTPLCLPPGATKPARCR